MSKWQKSIKQQMETCFRFVGGCASTASDTAVWRELHLNSDQEESVEQYVRRNLGKEVFERLVEPFCSGVYAGDPSKLSMIAAFGKVHCKLIFQLL